SCVELCNAFRVETSERLSVTFSFLQHSEPGQTGLSAFQNQKFKQGLVVVDRSSPLTIVILYHQRMLARPRATFFLHYSLIIRPSSLLKRFHARVPLRSYAFEWYRRSSFLVSLGLRGAEQRNRKRKYIL